VLTDIAALRKIGVTGLDFDFEGRDAERAAEEMQRFKGEVLDRI
jgi:hypothetical protein